MVNSIQFNSIHYVFHTVKNDKFSKSFTIDNKLIIKICYMLTDVAHIHINDVFSVTIQFQLTYKWIFIQSCHISERENSKMHQNFILREREVVKLWEPQAELTLLNR